MSYKKVLKTIADLKKEKLLARDVQNVSNHLDNHGCDVDYGNFDRTKWGNCNNVNATAGKILSNLGHNVKPVTGYVNLTKPTADGENNLKHFWLNVNGKTVDFTKEQFYGHLEDNDHFHEDNPNWDYLNTNSHPNYKALKTWNNNDSFVQEHINHDIASSFVKSNEKQQKPNFPENKPVIKSEYDKNSKESQKNPNVKLNTEHGKTIADAYHNMKHDPNHPDVQRAYGSLINETKNQFNDIMSSGLKISRITPDMENPYKNSKELHHDIENNNHLWYFPTEGGFGGEGDKTPDHPMLGKTGLKHGEHELLANDIFRIVHDINGHHKGGKSGFGAKGEHQAYLTHKKMYSPEAQKALTTETLGQNSWVNFGPHGEHNRKNPEQTRYAEQKAGLLPDHIVQGDWHTDSQPEAPKQPNLQQNLPKKP